MTKRSTLSIGALFALAAVVVAAGCGSSEGGDYGGPHPDYAKELAGSPPALAALHREADELLPGGSDAYERRLAKLRGYPVVVNVWASWCNPCRVEFPSLQQLSARYGKRVAFLGVDSQDAEDAAATFLRDNPVPYPSFSDPGSEIHDELGARGLPATAFYDRSGELVFVHQGQYADQAALEEDLRRYALGSG